MKAYLNNNYGIKATKSSKTQYKVQLELIGVRKHKNDWLFDTIKKVVYYRKNNIKEVFETLIKSFENDDFDTQDFYCNDINVEFINDIKMHKDTTMLYDIVGGGLSW